MIKKSMSMCFKLSFMILLASCATSYGPKGIMGGYSEIQIDETTFQVFFEGNQQTTKEQIRTQLMFRCAELTIKHGFSHFMILSDESIEHQEFEQANVSITKGMGPMVNTRVEVEEPNSNIVGVYTIKMLAKADPVYASASINAVDFLEKNKHHIKR
ncbi:MAG: hypothetical protein HQ508_04815 [Candidatus Marinimicrobia bacterium]|nr:hypothetical protein [Candidatus Neomarinimicrobiota bacterium]